jgi:lysozyme
MKMPSKVPKALASSLAALVMLAAGVSIQNAEPTPEALRNEYVRAVAADPGTSMAVKIAMVMGSQYESSGKHIGTPYVDKLGRGQPLTVCNGVTGPEVIAGRYYTPADCYRIEKRRYLLAEAAAARLLRYWQSYDDFTKATFIDFTWNKGEQKLEISTMRAKANRGDLEGACRENPNWNKGTKNGVLQVLPGLQIRGDSNGEICADWHLGGS